MEEHAFLLWRRRKQQQGQEQKQQQGQWQKQELKQGQREIPTGSCLLQHARRMFCQTQGQCGQPSPREQALAWRQQLPQPAVTRVTSSAQ